MPVEHVSVGQQVKMTAYLIVKEMALGIGQNQVHFLQIIVKIVIIVFIMIVKLIVMVFGVDMQ